MESNLLFLLVFIPLLIATINILLPSYIGKLLAFVASAYTIFLLVMIFLFGGVEYSLFGTIIFSLDEMKLLILVFIQVLGFIILLFSLKGIEKDIEKKFFVLYPFTVSFCNGAVLSENIFIFIIFWGLSGLTLYMFGTLGKTLNAPAAAKKTFIIVGGSDAFLIMGIAIMLFLQPEANGSLSAYRLNFEGELSYIAFLFLLVAAFAKAGGFPFHTWVPDFSKEAPIESVAFLPASLDKLLGIYLLAKMVTVLFVLNILIHLIIITIGAITLVSAVMMAMNQHNGRKLLGYHAVSQVGYMIMGIGSGSVLAFAGGLFHMVNHTIYKSTLFLSLGSVEKQTGTNELDYLGGLGKNMPATFIMTLIGALSISGIPPFNGFFSKWMIYQGLLEKTRELTAGYQIWMLICIILAIFGSALTLASFMKFIHAIYLGRRPEIYNNIKETSPNQWLATGLLSLLCVVFGIFSVELPLQKFIYPAVEAVGYSIPAFAGLYNPQLIVILFLIGFALGILIYLLTAKVKYDEVYLGGMSPAEKFRVAGTEFYNEIRNMKPLKSIYDWAEKKYFDIYDVGSKITFGFSHAFQKAHPGQLQLYVLYIIAGMLLFILIIR
ncbi:MAG: hypothetical protein C4539_11940 [Ignavibacteriales bacterium]|nr:MAG: hypothetical protein C4539_11940 [Ignavibacteriales bacterium]